MKKVFVLSLTLLTTMFSSAWAAYPIEGTWGVQHFENGIQFDVTFAIHGNTLVVQNTCSAGGHVVTAQVSSPVSVDANTMTVLGSAQDQKSDPTGSLNCTAFVQQDRINYSVNGNQLVLTHDGSNDTFVMERRGN